MGHDLKAISQVYYNSGRGGETLDFVIKRNGEIVEVIEGVSPNKVEIFKNSSTKIEFPLLLDPTLKGEKLSIEEARKRGFPGNYLPVRINGNTYFLDSGFQSNNQLLNNLNLLR